MRGSKYILYNPGVGEHRAAHSISGDQRSWAHRPGHALSGTHSITLYTFLKFSINYPSLIIRILSKNSLCGLSWKIRPRNSGPASLSDNQRLDLKSHPRIPKMPPLTPVSPISGCTCGCLIVCDPLIQTVHFLQVHTTNHAGNYFLSAEISWAN